MTHLFHNHTLFSTPWAVHHSPVLGWIVPVVSIWNIFSQCSPHVSQSKRYSIVTFVLGNLPHSTTLCYVFCLKGDVKEEKALSGKRSSIVSKAGIGTGCLFTTHWSTNSAIQHEYSFDKTLKFPFSHWNVSFLTYFWTLHLWLHTRLTSCYSVTLNISSAFVVGFRPSFHNH